MTDRGLLEAFQASTCGSFQRFFLQAIAVLPLFLFLIDQLEPPAEGDEKDYRQAGDNQKDIVPQEDPVGRATQDGKKDRNVAWAGEGSDS